MEKVKKILNKIFIDGLSGMALGLFATLIVGTIIQQIGVLIPGVIGSTLFLVGKVAASLTGAGIGCGVAYKFKEAPLVMLSSATCGMVGAFAGKLMAGTVFTDGVIHYAGPGEPLGAFIAAYVGIVIGHLISGKTKVDILITPLCSICAGSAVGLLLGPPISAFMGWIGAMVNLPISSAAIGVVLNLSGIAAGAATVGCCANMIGFAVASYRENKLGGLLAQGLGTSMLQVPNIVRKPVIWLPAIITSAILGPISTAVLGMTSNATGSGMGTAGLVGPLMSYQTMVETQAPWWVLVQILLMQFILPALLSLGISELMRKKGWIQFGDMKLDM